MKKVMILILTVLLVFSINAQNTADKIAGNWYNEDLDKSTINIFGINGEEKESKSVVYFVFVGIIVLALILVACAIFFRFRKAKETSVNL